MPKIRSSARRSYSNRRKRSQCRGISTAKCRNRTGCKMALGKKRSFCRKSKNARRRTRTRSRTPKKKNKRTGKRRSTRLLDQYWRPV